MTLYIGVTNKLLRRVIEHKKGLIKGFTKNHNVNKLVYYEQTNDIRIAIQREKQLKKWNRKWKINLLKKVNPDWNNLFIEIGGCDEMLDENFTMN